MGTMGVRAVLAGAFLATAGALGGVQAEAKPTHGRSHSIEVRLPGLSVVIFRQKR